MIDIDEEILMTKERLHRLERAQIRRQNVISARKWLDVPQATVSIGSVGNYGEFLIANLSISARHALENFLNEVAASVEDLVTGDGE